MPRDENSTTGSGAAQSSGNSALKHKAAPTIRYEIRIQGLVSNHWFDCFDGLVFQVLEKNQTLILANLTDKSALHGLLTKIGELNLTVLSVRKVDETINSSEI